VQLLVNESSSTFRHLSGAAVYSFVEMSLKFTYLHDKVNAVSVRVMYGECCVLLGGQDQRPLQRPGMGRSSGRR